MSLDIDCPQCGAVESIDEASLPPGPATLTCKQCRYQWPFHRPQGLGGLAGAKPPAKARGGGGRKVRAPGPTGDDHDEVTCPGCGLSFLVGAAKTVDENAITAEMAPAPPPRRARPAPQAKPKRRRRKEGKKTILVLEDVDYFVQLAQETLGSKYHTIIVKSVQEALRAIEREAIDLLVLDLALGESDGGSVLEQLQGREFPVLISTSRDETEMYGEAWEDLKRLGADDVLIKGMNMEERLLQKVTDLLGRS